MNAFNIFHSQDPILIATFALLVGMSITSWSIIIRKFTTIKKEQKVIETFSAKYQKPTEVLQSLNEIHFSPIRPIIEEAVKVRAAVLNLPQSDAKEIIAISLVQALDTEKTKLDSGLTTLASIASSAPFIGLFGTVWGIYTALLEISAQGSAGLSVVAGPMGEALVATAVGLFTAIPAVLAYNAFARSNRLIIQSLRHISEKLTIYLVTPCQ